ncbi:MAG: hypothetical protein ABJB74_16660 [Gemmatimonas sp.]
MQPRTLSAILRALMYMQLADEACNRVTAGKEKANMMRQYWVPAINNDGTFGRWAVAEFTDVYAMETDFSAPLEAAVSALLESLAEPAHA